MRHLESVGLVSAVEQLFKEEENESPYFQSLCRCVRMGVLMCVPVRLAWVCVGCTLVCQAWYRSDT